MNPAQANALLMLIADLARIVYNPPPEPPAPEPTTNNRAKEPIPSPS